MDKNLKSFLLIILTYFFIASRTSGTSFQEKSLHGTPAKPQKISASPKIHLTIVQSFCTFIVRS